MSPKVSYCETSVSVRLIYREADLEGANLNENFGTKRISSKWELDSLMFHLVSDEAKYLHHTSYSLLRYVKLTKPKIKFIIFN
jgi:hypothetical protein